MTDIKKKILIVEDEKNIAQVLAFNLMQAGYDYEIAMDGEEGLRKALKGNFDLILLDIMLPKMDGFTVCRGIRMRLDTPIIMVTAKEEDVDKILGLDLGADDPFPRQPGRSAGSILQSHFFKAHWRRRTIFSAPASILRFASTYSKRARPLGPALSGLILY